MRNISKYQINNSAFNLESLSGIVDDYEKLVVLNSNNYKDNKYHKYDLLAGFGEIDSISIEKDNDKGSFKRLNDFIEKYRADWILGHLNYDLKNAIEQLGSENQDRLGFPAITFFVPEIMIVIKGNELIIETHPSCSFDPDKLFKKSKTPAPNIASSHLEIKNRITKEQYFEAISGIKKHIQRGDIFELNFCQEFYCDNAEISPFQTWLKLNKLSPTPFSAFYKINNQYLLCASPERYICKRNNTLISQPIKGTAARSNNPDEDKRNKDILRKSEKDISENIMIVDLVRNDFSRVAEKSSVKATEVCEIYSYPKVHQMISTIECKLRPGTKFGDIIEASFPMGSMTGAPKIMAMELIDKYESHKRGLFSGSIGYLDPENDFDFNVVIRSILYNKNENYLSFSTGGAITNASKEEDEYAESQLKASAIKEVLG
jgi:para-aminobenzoate synthetase component 1